MRELGLALRKAMRAAGLENKDVARRLGCSPSKVSYMLSGRRGVSEADVASILAICDVRGAERDRLLRLTREAHESGWWQEYGDRLPAKLRTLIDHEDAAIAITQYQSNLVPGLLQVPNYVRAWMQLSATVPDHEVEERVDARVKRQELLNRRNPAQFRFFIDEYVLRPSSVGSETMSEQVHHLLRMSVRPHVGIRVIPESVGLHAGYAGPFMLMEFAEIKPVVHLDHETSCVFAERPETIRAYRSVLAALAEVALDREQSREWTARLASELGVPREEHDEPA